MTNSSPAGRSLGRMVLAGVAALLTVGSSACLRPPTSNEAGPFSCTGWTKIATTPFPGTYYGIWGSSPRDVYFLLSDLSPGKSSAVKHYDGTNVTNVTNVTTLLTSPGSPYIGVPACVWGSSASNVYVGTSEGGLLRFDGAAWNKVAGVPVLTNQQIWGTGADNVYVVGAGGVGHFDGTSWSTVLSVDAYTFNSIWGSGPDDVFVAAQTRTNGSNGAVYHFDGTSWSTPLSRPWSVFGAVWGSGSADVLAAGYSGGAGFIYRFDGQTWSEQTLPWSETNIGQLRLLWGRSGSRVFSGGLHSLLGWDGQQWHAIDVPSSSHDDIKGIWGSGTTLFVAANEWNGESAIWRATCAP